jgi:hypothetical protein
VRLLVLSVALLVGTGVAGIARPAWTGQPSVAIPSSVSRAISQAFGPSAYVPTFLPTGYRFAGWKNESPNVAPVPGAPWFVVKFEHGAARLFWTVSVTPGAGGDQRCSDLSIGHATVGGQATFWGPLTTYAPLEGGPKGRHVWRCVNSSDGRRLILDAFDQGVRLSIPVMSRIVARSSSA